MGGKTVQTYAAKLANASPTLSCDFIPQYYSTDPSSVPILKASDVLKGRSKAIAGKDIVLGTTAEGIDQYFIPGRG